MTTTHLLGELVDDAGLFPPTALDMPAALDRHRADQAGGEGMLTHRFLCPASRIEELRGHLLDSDHLRLGLIADRGAQGLAEVLGVIEQDRRLSVALVEMPLAAFAGSVTTALDAVRDLPVDVEVFLEPPTPGDIDAVLAAVAESASGRRRVGAKLRCGGVRAELFPTSSQVAHFIAACRGAGVPFKATAGLHHGVRHIDPSTGFTHHGYLNLLLAAATADRDSDNTGLRAALELDDPGDLATRIGELDPEAVAAARAQFVSYGSCSTRTPVQEARDLLARTGPRS